MMPLNLDVSKQAQEVVFSKKSHKHSHLFVLFKNIPVQSASTKKHLGVYLDEKLNFNTHIREKIGTTSKGFGAGG